MEILFFLSLPRDERRKSCPGNTAGEQVTSEFCFAGCSCFPSCCPKRQRCDRDNNDLMGFLIRIGFITAPAFREIFLKTLLKSLSSLNQHEP